MPKKKKESFQRFCRKCGEIFCAKGRYCEICASCQEIANKERFKKNRNANNVIQNVGKKKGN